MIIITNSRTRILHLAPLAKGTQFNAILRIRSLPPYHNARKCEQMTDSHFPSHRTGVSNQRIVPLMHFAVDLSGRWRNGFVALPTGCSRPLFTNAYVAALQQS